LYRDRDELLCARKKAGFDKDNMKILFLLQDIPYPPSEGIRWKAYNLIKYLANLHECHVLSFGDGDVARVKCFMDDVPAVHVVDVVPLPKPGLGLFFKKIGKVLQGLPPSLAGYNSQLFRQRLEKTMHEHQYDVVHYDIVNMAQYAVYAQGVPSIHSPNDATSLSCFRKAGQEGNLLIKLRLLISAVLLKIYEREIYPRFTKIHVVSPVDRQYLKSINSDIDIETVPIAVDKAFLQAKRMSGPERRNLTRSKNVTFIGDLRIQGIVNGLCEFLSESWPLIQQDHPGVQLRILGRNASPRLHQHLSSLPSVKYESWVDDYVRYLAASDVVIFPDKSGTGIKNRVLQAMAMGLPVVGSPVAFEGIYEQKDFQRMEISEQSEFTKTVSQLLGSAERRKLTGDASRQFVRRYYSLEVVGPQYEEMYQKVAGDSAGSLRIPSQSHPIGS
jgi:polysaccharide biosynthesis protein PslH